MDYKIDSFATHDDDRGRLVVFLKQSELPSDCEKFGQIYFVTFNKKNIIRGNHYHKKWKEWFGLVSGKVELKLVDIRTRQEKVYTLDANDNKYLRLVVGPYVAHAFRSLSDHAALLNYTNIEWSPDDTFEYIVLK